MEGPFQRTLFTAGNAGADEVEALVGQFAVTTDGVLIVGVAAVDQDIALVQVRSQRGNGFIRCFARFHHQQDAARFFQRFDKLFNGVIRRQILARVLSDHFVSFVARTVENGNGVTTALDVQREVAAHYRHADNADLLLGHLGTPV